MYSTTINAYFSWCVHLLQDMSAWMRISYQELNVWVFVVIHPLITLLLAYWIIRKFYPPKLNDIFLIGPNLSRAVSKFHHHWNCNRSVAGQVLPLWLWYLSHLRTF
jgi:hypothetical protein